MCMLVWVVPFIIFLVWAPWVSEGIGNCLVSFMSIFPFLINWIHKLPWTYKWRFRFFFVHTHFNDPYSLIPNTDQTYRVHPAKPILPFSRWSLIITAVYSTLYIRNKGLLPFHIHRLHLRARAAGGSRRGIRPSSIHPSTEAVGFSLQLHIGLGINIRNMGSPVTTSIESIAAPPRLFSIFNISLRALDVLFIALSAILRDSIRKSHWNACIYGRIRPHV